MAMKHMRKLRNTCDIMVSNYFRDKYPKSIFWGPLITKLAEISVSSIGTTRLFSSQTCLGSSDSRRGEALKRYNWAKGAKISRWSLQIPTAPCTNVKECLVCYKHCLYPKKSAVAQSCRQEQFTIIDGSNPRTIQQLSLSDMDHQRLPASDMNNPTQIHQKGKNLQKACKDTY